MKNKKIGFFILLALIIAIIGIFTIYFFNKQSNASVQSDFTLDATTLESLNEFNQKLDEYYIETWDNNKFISYYSYLATNDYTEIMLEDVEKALNYTAPEEIKDVQIHFVKPKSLKPYLGDNIIDDDPEVLTVYSALPVEGGMYISSKFDKGGFVSSENYKKFVSEHSWLKGETRMPDKDSEEYKEVIKAVEKKDENLKDGNVKHLACNDKYAMIVISSKDDPAYIKQYALEKQKNGKYDIIIEELELRDNKIFVNYAYTDFDLALLPLYEIYLYNNIQSNQTYLVDLLKENERIGVDEELTYSCGAGNFVYLEFKSGLKILLYANENNTTDVYEVENFTVALSKMLELEPNPPVFILNFE